MLTETSTAHDRLARNSSAPKLSLLDGEPWSNVIHSLDWTKTLGFDFPEQITDVSFGDLAARNLSSISTCPTPGAIKQRRTEIALRDLLIRIGTAP